MQKEIKGITLITLIITVILILIIAGVAMSMISPDGGLFEEAKYAREEYNKGASNEAQTIDDLLGALIDTDTMVSKIEPSNIPTPEGKLILSAPEGYTPQYEIGGNGWQNYTEEVPIIANGYINTRLRDEKGRFSSIRTINVTNIDRVNPNPFELTTEVTTSSIIVKPENIETLKDTASEGAADWVAGISKYQYCLDGNWGEETFQPYYEFNGLEQGSTHTISMKIIDKAGNPTEATNRGQIVQVKFGPRKISDMVADESIKPGDYIDYDIGMGTNNNNGLFTITAAQSGYTAAQTYDVTKYAGRWKVLHVYKDLGTVDIISTRQCFNRNCRNC